ncbi:MAG TPA: radical SAM family heme chaperone HemW [Saprospiraceae bacterium]|nr:radical SAM family heme chaperone HemW [Saprospiraceae bacterium]
MAGIYIHIPFCKKACHYCDFHFSTSFQKKDEMISALIKEIHLRADYLEGQEIETIYFGGGTPSAVPASDIKKILDAVKEKFQVVPNVEITLEANPDDIRSESAEAWKSIGINRLSIGIQAFQEDLLKAWNRSHTSQQAKTAIELSQQAGFQNITVDLIYGGPGLSDEDWRYNINILIESGIPHISCYALTVEKGTALAHQIEKGRVMAPDDEQSNRQYAILQTILKRNGFTQYEVSNFSKPGMESRHNRNYWSGAHYLGIGPAAHSFNGVSRQWNISNNIKYINALQENVIPFEKETLTNAQRYNEVVMIGLRTSHGIEAVRIKELGDEFVHYLQNVVARYADRFYKNESGNWVLRPEYYFFSDGIAADLFYSSPTH